MGYLSTDKKKITTKTFAEMKQAGEKATTMDTTLPILSQTVGQRYIALSIYHGFVVDFTVTFLVSWWCMV